MNPALLLVLFMLWIPLRCHLFLYGSRFVKYYDKMRKYYKSRTNSSYDTLGNRSSMTTTTREYSVTDLHLPQMSVYLFALLGLIFSAFAFIAFYLSLDGNCVLIPGNLDDNDLISNHNYITGLVELIFLMLNFILYYLWVFMFFQMRTYRGAFIVSLFILIFDGVILWAMASTKACTGDTVQNRNWIAFGLFAVDVAWELFVLWMSFVWWRVVGVSLDKLHPHYSEMKARYTKDKVGVKTDRYGRRGQSQQVQESISYEDDYVAGRHTINNDDNGGGGGGGGGGPNYNIGGRPLVPYVFDNTKAVFNSMVPVYPPPSSSGYGVGDSYVAAPYLPNNPSPQPQYYNNRQSNNIPPPLDSFSTQR